MKISFCITYYNQENFVKSSIESIFAIEIPCDFEILVGDDGSNDGTIKKVESYQEKYPNKIKLFCMPRRKDIKYNPIHRVSANRLNLVKNATGDFIMFLDGDDFYYDKDFIKEALSIFERYREIICCAFNFKYVFLNDGGGCKVFRQRLRDGYICASRYIKYAHYIHSGAIVFRNIFDKEKIDILEKSNYFDDNLITIYMLQFGDLYYRAIPIYAYTQNENSIWNSASSVEQSLLHTMDFETISRTAPKFKKEMWYRQFTGIKYIYKNRNKIKKALGDLKYELYYKENIESKNDFVLALLDYDKLRISQKLKIKLLIIVSSYKKYFQRAIKFFNFYILKK